MIDKNQIKERRVMTKFPNPCLMNQLRYPHTSILSIPGYRARIVYKRDIHS